MALGHIPKRAHFKCNIPRCISHKLQEARFKCNIPRSINHKPSALSGTNWNQCYPGSQPKAAIFVRIAPWFLNVITSKVSDVLKLQQATGSLGRHLPEEISDRSAGGGAEKGSNYVS